MPSKYIVFTISSLNGQLSLDRLKINQRSYYELPNSAVWGWLSVESQPQNPEFRNNPENIHPCLKAAKSHLNLGIFLKHFLLTHYLLVSSVDNLCQQSRPRMSGLIWIQIVWDCFKSILRVLSAFYICCIYSSVLQTRIFQGSKQH